MNRTLPKLLCLAGPTSTGKTALANKLIKKLNLPSVLISADSRQVYRGMDIVTGKDHDPSMSLAGIDLVTPDQACSVSVWYRAIEPYLTSSPLTIVVGGTGLWFKALFNGIETMSIPPDPALRHRLESLTLKELQAELAVLAPSRLSSLNHSDLHNPRRLIRAIEIAQSSHFDQGALPKTTTGRDTLFLGLRYSSLNLYQAKIRERVLSRLQLGAIEETKKLLAQYPAGSPALTAIGYRSIIRFLKAEITQNELIEIWTTDELNYAKRQLTWFKKVKNIHWYEVDQPDYYSAVESAVQKWYDKPSYEHQ